ncbi:MAG: hypothetical protein M1541_13515 [Acidobacteria bacterium]|nr:hypothetical protein [Acidobacteriota bacterium]
MNNDCLHQISLPLDERNLAHVLSAVTFAVLSSRMPDARPFESACWWTEHEFVLKTAIGQATLFDAADKFLRSIRWISGVGGKEHGTFIAENEIGSNPFISLAENGQESSPFKTFAANQEPAKDLLDKQRESLQPPASTPSWLCQMAYGISSWGLDSRVGSHAYDLGFSSNDEGTGERDPIYPAVELLSIAAASFFAALQGWQMDEDTVAYAIWSQPVAVSLVPYIIAGRLYEFPARLYRVATRGGAYGKGGAFRFFPEAVPDSNRVRKGYERKTENR